VEHVSLLLTAAALLEDFKESINVTYVVTLNITLLELKNTQKKLTMTHREVLMMVVNGRDGLSHEAASRLWLCLLSHTEPAETNYQ
jgi:hypothetical protein